MVTTRRGTYPRGGSVSLRPRRLIRRRRVGRKMPRIPRPRPGPKVGMKRRASTRAGASMTKRRRRVYRDRAGYQQRDTVVSRAGRKVSNYAFMSKLVKCSYSSVKLLLRGYGKDSAGGADAGGRLFYELGVRNDSANSISMPLYAVNLSMVPQYPNGTAINDACVYRLVNTAPGFSWAAQGGLSPTGTSVGSVQFAAMDGRYHSGNPTLSTGVVQGPPTYEKLLLEYLNIKYTFRGPTNRFTRIIVEVVQPFKWFRCMPGGSTDQMGVWEAEAQRLCVNQCQSSMTHFRKPWRVLYTRVYELQPTLTTETDTAGHEVHQRYFWKCNRIQNYRDTKPQTQDPTAVTDTEIGVDVGDFDGLSTRPAPGTDLWMIIKAYSPDTGATVFDPATQPSFDLSVEKKCSFLY